MQKGSIVRELAEPHRYFIVREIEENDNYKSTQLFCRELDSPFSETLLVFWPDQVEELDPVEIIRLRQTKEFSHLTVI